MVVSTKNVCCGGGGDTRRYVKCQSAGGLRLIQGMTDGGKHSETRVAGGGRARVMLIISLARLQLCEFIHMHMQKRRWFLHAKTLQNLHYESSS